MLLPGPAKLKALQPVWKLLQRAQGSAVGSCKRRSWLPGLQHLFKGCDKLLIAHLSDPAQNASQLTITCMSLVLASPIPQK